MAEATPPARARNNMAMQIPSFMMVAPFASADDSRPHPGTEHEPTPAGAMWPFPPAARALVARVGAADAPSRHVSSPRKRGSSRGETRKRRRKPGNRRERGRRQAL